MRKNYEMDMCHGPLFGKLLRFAVPLMLSSVLQLLFNAADVIVVGQFSGNQALAAVGSTSSLISLLVNLFIGLSVGANVMVARYYGAGDRDHLSQTTHTAILTALAGGTFLIFVGIALSRPVLELMGTPPDVIDQSILYMRIYFLGMPFFVVYNFGAAILRAVGDTRRPLYFLIVAGIINVIFNLFFVIVFKLGVAGVAIATVISQIISAVLVLLCLTRADGIYRVNLKALHIYRDKLWSMLRIGLPAGLQSVVVNLSNVLIQSSVNSFGSLAMAGHTAASNVENFLYVSVNAVSQTALSFTSQNMGARLYKRVDEVLKKCLLIVVCLGFTMGWLMFLCGRPLLHIFSPDPEVVEYGMIRMAILGIPYAICGLMDVLPGALRGIGSSLMPTIISLTGTCLFRVFWIYTIFRAAPSLEILYLSYPISWSLTVLMQGTCYFFERRRLFRKAQAEAPLEAQV